MIILNSLIFVLQVEDETCIIIYLFNSINYSLLEFKEMNEKISQLYFVEIQSIYYIFVEPNKVHSFPSFLFNSFTLKIGKKTNTKIKEKKNAFDASNK